MTEHMPINITVSCRDAELLEESRKYLIVKNNAGIKQGFTLDMANGIIELNSQIESLTAQLEEVKTQTETWKYAVALDNYKIDQLLGKALGYPEASEDIGGYCDGSVVTGEHIPVTLAMEAADKIKSLWADNQAMQAKIEGMEGGIQLNKMIMDAAEEKLRVAEEALEFYANEDNYIPSMLSYGRLINPRIWQERSKIAQQALSTIRGK